MKQEISHKYGCIQATLSGSFSLNAAERFFLEMIEAAAENKCAKILVDGSGITGKPENMERFYYGEWAANKMRELRIRIKSDVKIAYYLKIPVLDLNRFGETVGINRGLSWKAFDNLDGALSWLAKS